MKTLMPSDPFPTYALGLEYQEMGEAIKPIAFFEETMLKFSDYLPVYYQLIARTIKDLKTMGELQEALFNIEE